MTSILMFGRDVRLLETRAWVLETAGYRVRTVASGDALLRALETEPADLLVLCHSLSKQECDQALALTRGHGEIKSLVLTTGERGCNFPVPEPVFDITKGPATLLSIIRKLATPGNIVHNLAF